MYFNFAILVLLTICYGIQDEAIRRTLTSAASMESVSAPSDRNMVSQYHFRAMDSNYFGVEASLNVIRPKLHDTNQYSGAFVILQDFNRSFISVGWEVNPTTYGDNKTHFAVYHSSGEQTFVNVSSDYYNGMILTPSKYGDVTQQEMTIRIGQDQNTKDWWISYESEYVGYIPSEYVLKLSEGAKMVAFEGRVLVSGNDVSPPMGHGTFPLDPFGGKIADYDRVGYFAEIQLLNSKYERAELFGERGVLNGCSSFYQTVLLNEEKENGHVIMYGGPGGKVRDC